ncbi:MAG: FtsX-like permease family protein [Oligoflexales bacterium]
MAVRYLKTGRDNHFFSWITLLSVLGIGIGVSALIVVISVFNGFERELRDRFLAANAHVLFFRFPYGLVDVDEWEKELKNKLHGQTTGLAPFVHAETMLRAKGAAHHVLIKGLSPKARENVQRVGQIIQPTQSLSDLQDEIDLVEAGHSLPEKNKIILGSGLMKLIDAKVGDTVHLLSQSIKESESDDLHAFTISGTYNSGLKHYDNRLGLVSLSAAQKLFRMGKTVTGIEIGLKKPNTSPQVAETLSTSYNLSVKEWQSYNQNLHQAIRKERVTIGFIVALVAIVASINILGALFISVTQRQPEISLLRALGCHHNMILSLFLKQSLLIGLFGGFLGIILAGVISYLIENALPIVFALPDTYMLTQLPVEYNPFVYLFISLAGVAVSAVAGLYPAIIASKVTPTMGLKGNVEI